MGGLMGRAATLGSRLERAAEELMAAIEGVDDGAWRNTPRDGVWSISKDAEHVADAAVYHQWIVRLTIGDGVSSRRRPSIERSAMTSSLSPADAASLIRERTDEGLSLLRGLTEAQLDMPTKPPRARNQRLAETIERVLIGHYDLHRREIEMKLATMVLQTDEFDGPEGSTTA